MAVWKNLTFGDVHAYRVNNTTYSNSSISDIKWEEPKGESMKVKRLNQNATLPTKAHDGDLGYDLYASDPLMIAPHETRLVKTGISIQFPAGYGGIIKDRSSIATKQYLFTVAGVIDNGYTGEIRIAFHNGSGQLQHIDRGQKIAQLVLIPVTNFTIEEVDEIVTSDGRGEGGFGSTGE